MSEAETTPTGTIDNCPYCGQYTKPGDVHMICPKQPQTTGKDILAIKDERDGRCIISVNSEEYRSDYSHAIKTLENMIKKLQRWEDKEAS